MAFNSNQLDTNRKILEDLHQKKQSLEKSFSGNSKSTPTVAPGVQGNPISGGISYQQNSQNNFTDFNSVSQRTGWTLSTLTTSFGFFIPQESLFGNSNLPVIPRFDTPKSTTPVNTK